jgi:proteasome lid subunit RPN8/RPN11
MPTPPTAPDVRQLRGEKLPEMAFPGGKEQSFRVFFDPTVHTQVWKHSTEDVSVEICGVLVGKWARDAGGPFVHISESIRGDAATNKFAEVTFTHDTWAKINHEMDTRFTHLAIVGWYHSHPGFGVFLSDRDRLAHVVDPVRKSEGVFIWNEGKTVLAPLYWVGNRLLAGGSRGHEEPVAAVQAAAPASDATPATTATEAKGGGNWLLLLAQGALLVTVFLLGYLLASKVDSVDRARIEQSALARGWFAHRNPTLREDIGEAGLDLAAAAQASKALSEEHLKRLSEPEEIKEAKDKWNEAFSRLNKAFRKMGQIQAVYGLTPEEAAHIKAVQAAKSAPDEKKDQPKDDKEKTKPDEKKKTKEGKPTAEQAQPDEKDKKTDKNP